MLCKDEGIKESLQLRLQAATRPAAAILKYQTKLDRIRCDVFRTFPCKYPNVDGSQLDYSHDQGALSVARLLVRVIRKLFPNAPSNTYRY